MREKRSFTFCRPWDKVDVLGTLCDRAVYSRIFSLSLFIDRDAG